MEKNKEKLKLMVLKSALEMGQKVDEHLKSMYETSNSFIVPTNEPWFDDGHGKVELLDSIRDKDVFIFTDIGNYSLEYKMHGFINHTSPNDLASQLKDTIGACKCHTDNISIVMPLLYNGRQHRQINREPLSCATYLKELDVYPSIKRIITFDAHDEGVRQALSSTEFDNFFATNNISEDFINNTPAEQLKNLIFVAPDFGAMGRMNFYLNSFNSEFITKDAGSFYKRRDYNRVIDGKNPIIEHSYSGNSNIAGTTAIVVDDMISSGSSMFDVIKELKKRGVCHIYIMVTYALFTKGIEQFKQYYAQGMFDGIYTTNLSYIKAEFKNEPWLYVSDCSNYIANIIYRLHNNESISPLLRDKSHISKVLTKKFGK
ncbi:MAG: ribose-phosphate diphosphokinase [Bacilli bacterium]|nr:ribose-phosphate diphosphokinase [Bacilli bacterium]